MKKLIFIIFVLAFNIYAFSCQLLPRDTLFTIFYTSGCKCNPLFNNTDCQHPSIITCISEIPLVPSGDCSTCCTWTICLINSSGGCINGTSRTYTNLDTLILDASNLPTASGYDYFTNSCYRVTRTVYICGDINNSMTSSQIFCLQRNLEFSGYHEICLGQTICNDLDSNYYYNWDICGVYHGWTKNPCYTATRICYDTVLFHDNTTLGCYSKWSFKVDSLHAVSVTITVDTNNFCAKKKDSVIFTAHPVYGGSSPSYKWYLNNQMKPANGSTYKLINPKNNDKVYCKMTSSLSETTPMCIRGNPANSDTIKMVVHPKINITDTLPIKVCQGDSVKLTIHAKNGTSPYSYEWYKGRVLIWKSDTTNSISFGQAAPIDDATYTYIATDSAGCADTMKVNLTVHPTPVITIVPPDTAKICVKNDSVQFEAYGAKTYVWSPSVGLNRVNDSIVIANPNSTSVYRVLATDVYTCTATKNETVYVGTPPKVTNTYLNVLKNAGDSLKLTLTPASGSQPFSFQWVRNGQIISGATDSILRINSITCSDTGIYSCIVKNTCATVIVEKIILYVDNCARYRHTLTGFVVYDNKDSTPLFNSQVFLSNSGDTIINTTTTDCKGFFVFVNLVNGYYKLSSSTNIPWGGSNPTDALIVNRTYIGMYNLTDPLKRLAADVNNDKKINPTDALIINRRYIGWYSSFTAKDWFFTNPTVHINGLDVNKNITAICSGDVNASYYIPTDYRCKIDSNSIKPHSSIIFNPMILTAMTHVSLDSVAGKPGLTDTIEVPLRVTNFDAAAFGLRFSFPNTLRFVSVSNIDSALSIGSLSYSPATIHDTIGIAWNASGNTSLHFQNKRLFNLKFVYLGGLTDTATIHFLSNSEVTNDSLSEVSVIYQNGFVYPYSSILGTVEYDNIDSIPMCNTTVYLCDTTGIILDSTITGSDGSYIFQNALPKGRYRLAISPPKPWGEINALDAEYEGRIVAGYIYPSDQLQYWASDLFPRYTNGDGQITVGDFVQDLRYALGFEVPEIPYWFIPSSNLVINQNQSSAIVSRDLTQSRKKFSDYYSGTIPYLDTTIVSMHSNQNNHMNSSTYSASLPYLDITIGSGDLTQNIKTIFLGKVGYIPPCPNLPIPPVVCTVSLDTIIPGSGGIVNIPVRVKSFNSIAAFSFKITYDANSLNFIEINNYNSAVYTNGYTMSNASNGILGIAWASIPGSVINLSDDTLFNLKFVNLIDTTSIISFKPDCIVGDSSLNKLNATYVNGFINTPPLYITAQPQNTIECPGDNFAIFIISAIGKDTIHYQWFKNDTVIAGATNYRFFNFPTAMSDSGYYKCIVSNKYSTLTSDSASLIINCAYRHMKINTYPKKPVSSVKDPDVNVYPNPNDGSFTLEVSLPTDGNVTLEAYNVIGENVLSEQHSMQKGVNKLNLKLNSTNKGIYFFNIVTASKTFNKKIIIE